MKTFKYLLLVILIFIIGFFTYVAVQPNKYEVKRTKVIHAPAKIIFNHINDLKKWENWGPWHDADSTIVTTYSENTIGVGATSSWTSKDGPGNMKIVNTVPNQTIDLSLQFGEYEPTDIHWILEEAEKETKVTWIMKSDNTPFLFKIFGALSGGMDNMLGPMEEQGLENLAKVVDTQIKNMPKAFTLGEVEEVTLPSQTFIGYLQKTSTDMSPEEMSKLFMEFMPKAGMYIADKLTPEAYIPGTFYTKWDEETKEAEFYIGLLLKTETAPAEGMTKIEIPEGKALKIAKFGNYGKGDYEAHTALAKHMQENNIEMNGTSVWELYVNDPTTVKPEEIQTDIYYPIK